MSEKQKSKYQGQPRQLKDRVTEPTYYLRNPAGAIHSVTREHAIRKLKDARYQLATDAEIERYFETRVQLAEDPIGTPWSPMPDVLRTVPDPAPVNRDYKASKYAEKLALAEGVNLSEVEGTGAEGQILKSDVEAFIEAREG